MAEFLKYVTLPQLNDTSISCSLRHWTA